jgi:hypothetical protein
MNTHNYPLIFFHGRSAAWDSRPSIKRVQQHGMNAGRNQAFWRQNGRLLFTPCTRFRLLWTSLLLDTAWVARLHLSVKKTPAYAKTPASCCLQLSMGTLPWSFRCALSGGGGPRTKSCHLRTFWADSEGRVCTRVPGRGHLDTRTCRIHPPAEWLHLDAPGASSEDVQPYFAASRAEPPDETRHGCVLTRGWH